MSGKGINSTTDGRSSIYHILSRSFTRPGDDYRELATALDQVLRFLDIPSDMGKDELDRLKLEVEYNRLFVGPGRLRCPPYESVHRKDRNELETGLVMGPSTMEVKRIYSEVGWEVNRELKDLPDHIAVELEFMHLLCEKELGSSDSGVWRKKEAEFVGAHLAPWAVGFADCVENTSTSPFYRSAARLLREFIRDEPPPLPPGGS